MFYAVEYTYGSHVVNNGNRADRIVEFTRRKLRDAWVAAGSPQIGPGERGNLSARSPLVRKSYGLEDGDREAWKVLAEQRVDRSSALTTHRYDLLVYEWAEPDHLMWVATAPEREILSWARSVKEDTAE